MLSIKNLNLQIGGEHILNDFSLALIPGQIQVLMGPNGSGKSTLANLLAGRPDLQPSSGAITISAADFYTTAMEDDSTNLLEISPDIRSKLGIFLAYQTPVDLPGIAPISYLKTIFNAHRQFRGQNELDSSQFLEFIRSQILQFGLPATLLERALLEGMSGGEKKSFELLQMIILEPKLIILDEIDSGLDLDKLQTLYQIIRTFKAENRSFIIITHNPQIAHQIDADVVHILRQGQIVNSGKPEHILNLIKNGFEL